jgi:hypothetical protein
MATAPVSRKLNLTRDQLATFLTDQQQIKQFENLFSLANQIEPPADNFNIEVQAGNSQAVANEALAQIVSLAKDVAINAGNADQRAMQALDTLSRIANSLEMLATAPVIQNNNSLVTDYIDLPEIGPHVTQPRRVQWNPDDGTMDVGLYGGSVLQVGQELMFYAKNTSGSLIPNGTPVMFTGTVGASGKLTFGLAVADGSVPADYMMGVTTQDIAKNDFGYVTNFGLVRGFNTTGAPYGESWNDGDLLYFGAAAPGTWTKVQPIAPRIDVPVAVVVNAGAGGSGSIFVRMTVAESLSRLQDVYITGLLNGNILVYDSADQRWENRAQSSLVVGRADNLSGGLAGSVPYQTAVNTTAMLGIGAANQVLTSSGTAPQWSTGLALTSASSVVVTDNTNPALRITQIGTGNALVVEDEANPDATPFVIDADGKVLIGYGTSLSATTNTPTLQKIGATLGDASILQALFNNSATNAGALYQTRGRGSIASPSAVQSSDALGGLIAEGYDSNVVLRRATAIQSFVDAAPGSGSMPGRLVFSTTPSGSATPVERLRIDSAGKILAAAGTNWVGTVSQSGTSSIIESGSNANGEFVKYADGTMMCSLSVNNNRSTTGVITTAVTLPATFINSSWTMGSTANTSRPDIQSSLSYLSKTTSSFTGYDNRTNTTANTFDMVVLGRWY